jgi:hypothetical protein
VWQRDQEVQEEIATAYGRTECPEFTIEWARDPSNLQKLAESLRVEEDSNVEYRLPPSPGGVWERLNDIGTTTLPASRALRAVTASGRIVRALCLVQTAVRILRRIVSHSFLSLLIRRALLTPLLPVTG